MEGLEVWVCSVVRVSSSDEMLNYNSRSYGSKGIEIFSTVQKENKVLVEVLLWWVSPMFEK